MLSDTKQKPAASSGERVYGGTSGERRRLDRRARLLDAAKRVYAEKGFQAATVRAICQEAGLTERYFYESFPNGEALFIAMHRDTSERIIADLRLAAAQANGNAEDRVRAMATAYYGGILRDPVAARLFAIDAVQIGPAAREVCAAWRQSFAALLAAAADPDRSVDDPVVRGGIARALLGIGVDWMESGFATPVDRVVRAACVIVGSLRQA